MPIDYEELRSRVRAEIAQRYQTRFPALRLTAIDDTALAAYRATWRPNDRHPVARAWDWSAMVRRRGRDPGRHELALWHWEAGAPSGTLHAMALGRGWNGRAVIAEYLETCPFGLHPFKGFVIPIVIQAVELYGALLGAEQIRLISVHKSTLGGYLDRGYHIESSDELTYYNLSKEMPR